MATLLAEDGVSDAKVNVADADYDLTEEQIEQMLKEAEDRLKQRNAAVTLTASDIKIPKLDSGIITTPYITSKGKVARANSSKLLDSTQRDLANKPRKVDDPLAVRKKIAEEKKATAGSMWFDLPRTDLTPELKRDLQLLKMRNVLDPHRHYKKENSKAAAPQYSQVGTIVEGPTEYYSARLQKRERHRTLVEEVLAGEANTGRFKRKYSEIQVAKTSGKKAHYKALKAKRAKKNK